MKKYVVEIVEKVVYKVECSDISQEYAEKFARTMYMIPVSLKALASWRVLHLM